MPRQRKTESQRLAERFRELYRVGKARVNATEEMVADVLGVSCPTLKKKRDNPEKYVSLGDFITLKIYFMWSDDDIFSFLHAGKR